MDRGDLATTARLHHDIMPDVFITRFGVKVLRQYHLAFASSPYAIALVATPSDGNRPIGFLLAAIDPASHYRYLVRHHGLQLAALVAAHLVSDPGLASELIRTRARRYASAVWRVLRPASSPAGVNGSLTDAVTEPRTSELVDVAVEPAWRSSGIGASLVRACEEVARGSGSERIELVTPPGDSGAGRFYERLGWHAVRELDSRSNEHFVLYRRELP